MARLVARALRLGRPALIQTGTSVERYCLSYLTPALMVKEPVILVASVSIQQHLLQREIPQLQQWLKSDKEIRTGDRWPIEDHFGGLLITTPDAWLTDRLEAQGRFPGDIPTLIEGADDLPEWTHQQLTASIYHRDWDELMQRCRQNIEGIREVRVKLTKAIFEHPANPYECYLLEDHEQKSLQELFEILGTDSLANPNFINFCHRWQTDNQMLWASISRESGQFSLHCSPIEVATALSRVWEQQTVVLMGSFLDWETSAPIYRQQVGLGDLTCLKFSPNQQNEQIQLYLPDRFPMPNTPQYQEAFMEKLYTLISFSSNIQQPVVLLVEDVPLKAQVGTKMAAEFGSRVQVEKTNLADNSILVSGWDFWRSHQDNLPTPQLLVIAALPLPSLENPLVAGRVAYYKRQHQDWFRVYLLPTALREIQRAVLPLRESQGVVALLDNRVNHRSYGKKILTALEPCAKFNYLDPSWFGLVH